MKKLLNILILTIIICSPIIALAEETRDTGDDDGDGILNYEDNCKSTPNQNQADENNDGIGDACDNSTQDTDRDGFPNDVDNCPNVRNQQFDGDNNGIGIACDPKEQEAIYEVLNQRTEETLEANENTAKRDQAISNFETCLGVNRGEICAYNSGGRTTFSPEPDAKSPMRKLYEGLINNKITTLLEEPIGNENIYQRARICETVFVRDRNGLLQFRNSTGFNPGFQNLAPGSSTETIISQYTNQATAGAEVIVALGKCEEYFVEKCTPSETETNNRFGRIGEPLPVKVFCDRVQVLFSTSGSDLVKNYVGLVYRWASGLVGVVAVLVIIINGIRITVSNGDQSAVENARGSIIKSLTSIALLFLAGVLLYSINPNFFTSSDLQENPSSTETATKETTPNE